MQKPDGSIQPDPNLDLDAVTDDIEIEVSDREICRRLGLRIKWIRAEKQIRQEDLSDRAGVFRTYMSRIEGGRANPSITTVYRIARALDVPVADLFEPVKDEHPPRVQSPEIRHSRGRVVR